MTFLETLYEAALPQLVLLIVGIVGSIALALWGRVQLWARRNLGVELERLDRDALNAAIATGVTLMLDRDVPPQMKIDMVLDYVRRSTPDAIARLNPTLDVVTQKIEARIAEVLSNQRMFAGWAPDADGGQPSAEAPPMGFGYSGITLASHLLLVVAILVVFGRAQALRFVPGSLEQVATSRYLRGAVIAALAVMIVERLFYVCARLLAFDGVDLWNAHPAPELLSFALAVAIYHVSVAALAASGELTRYRRRAVASEIVFLIGAWLLISFVLW